MTNEIFQAKKAIEFVYILCNKIFLVNTDFCNEGK